ncbi:MAG: NADPH-dependent F420 reductase [Actinobacteria bacterium]|nr:NADPH-dependent F420 reductase [Actinomycetota bacterium]
MGVTSDDVREPLGFVGGTGPLGRGLAARWARAGHPVHLGSRSVERAQEAVDDVRERIGDAGELTAATNEDAVTAAEIVVVSVPYEAQAAALPPLRDAIGDRIVVNVVNPMVFDDHGPRALPVQAGSAAEECQELLPDARVVSAFHDVSSRRLLRVDEPLVTHVLVCGDDDEAVHRVLHLAGRVEGMWGVRCGPLRNSAYVENLTPLILAINRRYGIQAGILIEGVGTDPSQLHPAP